MKYIFITRRVYISRLILFLFVFCLLSGCMENGPGVSSSVKKGPVQLLDVHGKLICQLHGQDVQLDCGNSNAAQRQVAFQFIDYALDELVSDLHTRLDSLPMSGLNVETTLDLDLQKQVLQKAKQYIATVANTHHMTNAGVLMMDYHSGAIRSLIGSLDSPKAEQPLNVVTKDLRQIGSLFKPIVYASAFERGISPGQVVYDSPFSVGSPAYTPFNYDGQYHGYMSYRTALQNNLNIPALKLFVKTGFDSVRKTAQDLGIKAERLPKTVYYSMPLGPMEMSLLDITEAYGTMANGGIRVPPHVIERVKDANGHIIYALKVQGIRALSPQAAFMITDVMSENKGLNTVYGHCNPFLLYTTSDKQCTAGNAGMIHPAAVHSGQTNTFRDSIVAGYTSDLVASVWAGNSDYSAMVDINDLNGAARIWHEGMLSAEANEPIKQFPEQPAGVVKKTVTYPDLTTTDWYRV